MISHCMFCLNHESNGVLGAGWRVLHIYSPVCAWRHDHLPLRWGLCLRHQGDSMSSSNSLVSHPCQCYQQPRCIVLHLLLQSHICHQDHCIDSLKGTIMHTALFTYLLASIAKYLLATGDISILQILGMPVVLSGAAVDLCLPVTCPFA